MRMLAIIGSLRAKSYNRSVFNAYRELVGVDAEFDEGIIGDFPLYDQDLQDQGFPVPVQRLAAQVERADAIIFFSPEYNYSVPGALKNAIDWLSRLSSKPLAHKPATVIGASPSKIGTARMQYHLRQIGVFVDLDFMNQPEVMISQVTQVVDASGSLTDAATRQFLRAHFDAFAKFAMKRNDSEPARLPQPGAQVEANT